MPAASALFVLAATAAALSPRCPFCPKPRTVRYVGVDAELLRTNGSSDIVKTIDAATAEGLNIVGVEDAYTCAGFQQLLRALEYTDRRHTHIRIIAGLESHGSIPRYCDPIFKQGNGTVNWINVTTTLARLSVKHPQLLGYRMDDFTSGLAQHHTTAPCDPTSSACWSPADVRDYVAAGQRINPKLRFLPVVYLQDLGALVPSGYTFGTGYGDALGPGSSVALVANFSTNSR